MKIIKENLKSLWYEDADRNKIDCDEDEYHPKGAVYQVSRFPLEVTTRYIRLANKDEVESCNHPRKYIERTHGWIDGIKGRRCNKCLGTQVGKKWHLWGKHWDSNSSKECFSFSSTTKGEDLLLAMANSGDWSLREAMTIYSECCERCLNVLYNKYIPNIDGYEEFSEEWYKCNTCCKYCEDLDSKE